MEPFSARRARAPIAVQATADAKRRFRRLGLLAASAEKKLRDSSWLPLIFSQRTGQYGKVFARHAASHALASAISTTFWEVGGSPSA
jgi:hypothetical protein